MMTTSTSTSTSTSTIWTSMSLRSNRNSSTRRAVR
jgi:hypothetical protein